MDKFRQILIEDYRRTYIQALKDICRWRFLVGLYPSSEYEQAIHDTMRVARSARRALRDMGEKIR